MDLKSSFGARTELSCARIPPGHLGEQPRDQHSRIDRCDDSVPRIADTQPTTTAVRIAIRFCGQALASSDIADRSRPFCS